MDTDISTRRGRGAELKLTFPEFWKAFAGANELAELWTQVFRDAQFQAQEQSLCARDRFDLMLFREPVEVPLFSHQFPRVFIRRHVPTIKKRPFTMNEIMPVIGSTQNFHWSVPMSATEVNAANSECLRRVVGGSIDGLFHEGSMA